MKDTLYLVVNVHRSGSSMMMRCLEAGGLVAVYDKTQDVMNHSAPTDYVPNPNGFYQFAQEVTPSFYQQYKGRLVKYPIREINKLPVGKYKVILLHRNPEEIRASMARWTPFNSWGGAETVTYFYDQFMAAAKEMLLKRNDVELLEVNYRDIVNSPSATFGAIKKFGFPIDVNECVLKVDISLYRNNLEKDK
jgi:hypothetical protein